MLRSRSIICVPLLSCLSLLAQSFTPFSVLHRLAAAKGRKEDRGIGAPPPLSPLYSSKFQFCRCVHRRRKEPGLTGTNSIACLNEVGVADSIFLQSAPHGSNFSQNRPETTKLRLLSNSILKVSSLWLEISMSVSTSGKKLNTFSGESKYGFFFNL